MTTLSGSETPKSEVEFRLQVTDGGGFHDIGLARAEWVWRSHLVAHERARVSTLIWPQRFTCRLGILHELCLDRDLSTLNSKHFSDKYAHPLTS